MSPREIKDIIETGKLTGYVDTGGFLTIYWKSPELSQQEYWVFKFVSATGKLVSINKDIPRGVYGKYQARKYVPMIKRLMDEQLTALKVLLS